MRRSYVENFMAIESSVRELSCKPTTGKTLTMLSLRKDVNGSVRFIVLRHGHIQYLKTKITYRFSYLYILI